MNHPSAITSGDLSSTSSDQKYPLGTRVTLKSATYGEQEYIYVKNGSGSSIAASLGVMIKNGTDDHTVVLSGSGIARARFVGVTHVAIADGYYGWVKMRGSGIVITDSGSGISANTGIKCAANGAFAAGTILTEETIGHVGTAISASATGPALIK